MSVPQSERRQSQVEYIIILQDIENFFINKFQSKEECIKGLSERLLQLSMNAYDNGTMYFELCNGKIIGSIDQKKEYCKKTFYTARQVASQTNMLIKYKMDRNKSVKELLIITQKLLKVCELLQNQLKSLNKIEEKSSI